MLLFNTLTKGNFWNGMMDSYPNATKEFCDWIDKYKKAVNWDDLFANHTRVSFMEIKYHDLPYDMQVGIWIRFAHDTLETLFEQPEYVYSGDLEEDVKSVFSEIEVEL